MSRTVHHRSYKHHPHRYSYDYGGKFRYNWHYGAGYGQRGRREAHREMRRDAHVIIRKELEGVA